MRTRFRCATASFTRVSSSSFRLEASSCESESESTPITLTASTPPFGGHSPRASWPPRTRPGSGRPRPCVSSPGCDVFEKVQCGLVACVVGPSVHAHLLYSRRVWRTACAYADAAPSCIVLARLCLRYNRHGAYVGRRQLAARGAVSPLHAITGALAIILMLFMLPGRQS